MQKWGRHQLSRPAVSVQGAGREEGHPSAGTHKAPDELSRHGHSRLSPGSGTKGQHAVTVHCVPAMMSPACTVEVAFPSRSHLLPPCPSTPPTPGRPLSARVCSVCNSCCPLFRLLTCYATWPGLRRPSWRPGNCYRRLHHRTLHSPCLLDP